LERARRGRGQPGRYWRGGSVMRGSEVVEESDNEDILNDSGYDDDMDMFEDDIDDRTVFFAFKTNTQDLETITEEILD
jgi:hypothetical protein